jgi:hypothetical protein
MEKTIPASIARRTILDEARDAVIAGAGRIAVASL